MMESTATAPIQILWKPTITYVQPFTADSDSRVWLPELERLLTLENQNGLTLQATQNAFENAKTYFTEAGKRFLLSTLPMPEFTPDGEGGIDIEWENKGRRLALNFSSDGQGDFLSWREPNGRYEGEPARERLFIQKLEWLMNLN